eukprot:15023146-Ditylum_brightwellii.AAC.1
MKEDIPAQKAHIDNLLAVRVNNEEELFPGVSAHTRPDYDLIQKIHRLKQLGITINTEWVEVHQDIKHPNSQLSSPAILNCMANTDASQYMSNSYDPQPTPSVLPYQKATLTVNNVVVTSKMQEIFQDASTCSNLKCYIKKKTGWTEDDFQEVNWKAHSDAFKSLILKNK